MILFTTVVISLLHYKVLAVEIQQGYVIGSVSVSRNLIVHRSPRYPPVTHLRCGIGRKSVRHCGGGNVVGISRYASPRVRVDRSGTVQSNPGWIISAFQVSTISQTNDIPLHCRRLTVWYSW